jgi:hypothetical protein
MAYISEQAEEYLNDHPEIDRDEFIERIEDEVLANSEFESEAIQAASDFKYEYKHVFPDLFEESFNDYTNRFLWCCYAIVWAIKQFDSAFGQTKAA